MPATISTVNSPASYILANKDLIDPKLWDRLVGRIVQDESMERTLAERIMDQTLAFLALCARDPQGHYGPSKHVDIGWHTFILYTRAYAAFCEEIGGRFIHHEPSDVEGVDYESGHVTKTVVALKEHGFIVDEPLWGSATGWCTSDCSYCSDD